MRISAALALIVATLLVTQDARAFVIADVDWDSTEAYEDSGGATQSTLSNDDPSNATGLGFFTGATLDTYTLDPSNPSADHIGSEGNALSHGSEFFEGSTYTLHLYRHDGSGQTFTVDRDGISTELFADVDWFSFSNFYEGDVDITLYAPDTLLGLPVPAYDYSGFRTQLWTSDAGSPGALVAEWTGLGTIRLEDLVFTESYFLRVSEDDPMRFNGSLGVALYQIAISAPEPAVPALVLLGALALLVLRARRLVGA